MNNIIIEGTPDSVEGIFFSFYIDMLFVGDSKPKYSILPSGGWTKLHLLDENIRQKTDAGGVNLVIFDADVKGNNGGYIKRMKKLESLRDSLDIEFELFLLPNNNKDGDLESLLEQCINNKHQGVLDCFYNYENCLKAYKKNGKLVYRLPQRKAMMYSYVDAFPKSKKEDEALKKKDYFFSNKDIWEFDNAYIKPLSSFLKKHIIL